MVSALWLGGPGPDQTPYPFSAHTPPDSPGERSANRTREVDVPATPFEGLPNDARLWIFGAMQPVVGSDARRFLEIVDSFVDRWAAHGHPVIGGRDWRHDHFLLVAADERATGVSGCSIDSLFHALKAAESELGITVLDSSAVWFRDSGGHVQAATRAEFREMAAAGEVSDETTVFDNTVATVGQLRDGSWERPMSESWHGRAFLARI